MHSQRSTKALSLTVLVALLAGCGGGGHQSTSALPASPSAGKAAASVAFRITIPNRSGSSSTRSPRYISTSTKSVAVAVNGGAPQIANLTPTSPNCTSTTPITCTVTIAAPAGNDTFDFTTYDQTGGTGNALSHSSFPATITAGTANTVNAILGGVAASVSFAGRQWTESLTEGTSAPPLTYKISALDAGGNAIIGPFDQPVTVNLVDPDHANAVTLVGTQFAQNGDTVTATYNGTSDPDGVTLQFSAGVTALASVTLAMFPAGFTANYPASLNGLLGWYDGQDLTSMQITLVGNAPTITKLLDKSSHHADLPAIAPNPTYDAIGGAEQRGSINFGDGSCLGPATSFPTTGGATTGYSIVVLEKPTPNTNIVVGGGFNETSALQGHALFFDSGQANNNLAMYQNRTDFVVGAAAGAGSRLIEADYQNNTQGVLYSDLGSPSAANPSAVVGNGITLDNTIAAGNTVTVTINGTAVTYTETASDTSATTAQGLASTINANATVKTVVTATATTYDTGGANPQINGLVRLTPASPTALISPLAVSATGATPTKLTITGNDAVDTSFYLNCFAGGSNTAGANHIEEAMLFDHPLSATERKNLQVYFNRKWGLGYGAGF